MEYQEGRIRCRPVFRYGPSSHRAEVIVVGRTGTSKAAATAATGATSVQLASRLGVGCSYISVLYLLSHA